MGEDKFTELHKAMSKFLSVAATVKKRNTPEWMDYFAKQINEAAVALGIEPFVEYPGSWSSEFHYNL